MFRPFKIKIFSGSEWIVLRVDPPRDGAIEHFWVVDYDLAGSFAVRENSVTKARDAGKFVIGQTRWPEVFWSYSFDTKDLDIVSLGQWSSGKTEYGEYETKGNVLMTFYDARVTKAGFEPMTGDGTGWAAVRSGGHMPMLRPGNRLKWEWQPLDYDPTYGN